LNLGFLREVDKICDLQVCYAGYGGNSLSTFRHNLLEGSRNPRISRFSDPWRWDR